MHSRGHRRPVVYDPNAHVGNARPAYHQAVGQREEGPLGEPRARWEVEDERRANGDVGGIARHLEDSQTLLTIWKTRRYTVV